MYSGITRTALRCTTVRAVVVPGQLTGWCALCGAGNPRISAGLSKEKLQQVAGREDLENVTQLKLIVDTTAGSR